MDARRLIIGGNPDAPAPAPQEGEFAREDNPSLMADYIDGGPLRDLAEAMIGEYHELSDLADLRIDYLWKREGGEKGGKPVLGGAQKLGGLARHYAGFTALVWVAADHTRLLELAHWQLEALVFHQLKKFMVDDGKLMIVSPDFEGFASEVVRYGLWHHDLQRAGTVMQQVRMDLTA